MCLGEDGNRHVCVLLRVLYKQIFQMISSALVFWFLVRKIIFNNMVFSIAENFTQKYGVDDTSTAN